MTQPSKMTTNRWLNYSRNERISVSSIAEFFIIGFIVIPVVMITFAVGLFVELILG